MIKIIIDNVEQIATQEQESQILLDWENNRNSLIVEAPKPTKEQLLAQLQLLTEQINSLE